MPIMRLEEIRNMSSEERTKKLGELRTELLRLRTMVRAGGTVENPARMKELRKTIARALTIESEQELGLGKTKTKEKKKEKKKK
ncbi:50S ribosomal protein L29 [Candidatus Bathyarchaeota archaeon]|nr:50S ribosomal protein L29 [Candidatus Bathyarchaeota archaeon]